jgi:chitin disaccharide deacetylase
MHTQCYLIVNADDFGQSSGVNRGVMAAHERGIVTSASLMVRWDAAEEAAASARRHPALSVGLHLDLGEWTCQQGSWVPVYQVVSEQAESALQQEVLRQLEDFRRLVGRDPTHLDSHQHVHRDEPLRSLSTKLAAELSVPLRHLSPKVRYCGDFYGQTAQGQTLPACIDVNHLVRILTSLPAGWTELACHPAAEVDLPSMYGPERIQELATLCAPQVREALNVHGIQLVSFHELP